MATKTKSTYIRIRCSAEWKELVEAAAAKTTESVSVLVRQAVNYYLDAESPGWDAGRILFFLFTRTEALARLMASNWQPKWQNNIDAPLRMQLGGGLEAVASR